MDNHERRGEESDLDKDCHRGKGNQVSERVITGISPAIT
jgi:hypothetical protein